MRDAGQEMRFEGDAGYETTKGATHTEFAPFSHSTFKLSSHLLTGIPDSSSASCIGSKFRIPDSSHVSSLLSLRPETNALDLTIHRSGSEAALTIPIRGVTATSLSRTGSPSRIRNGDEISDAP